MDHLETLPDSVLCSAFGKLANSLRCWILLSQSADADGYVRRPVHDIAGELDVMPSKVSVYLSRFEDAGLIERLSERGKPMVLRIRSHHELSA